MMGASHQFSQPQREGSVGSLHTRWRFQFHGGHLWFTAVSSKTSASRPSESLVVGSVRYLTTRNRGRTCKEIPNDLKLLNPQPSKAPATNNAHFVRNRSRHQTLTLQISHLQTVKRGNASLSCA